ncbi:MAG: hypothetical protein HYS18_14420 [Burkholderiales bacterium]|nr:hypothetical protein [Burkholderiales bacterium]
MKVEQSLSRVKKRLALWTVAVLGAAGILAACGGGSSSTSLAGSGVTSGGTGAVFSGPITGFGSVIVNGVRIDDSSASVTVDDGSGNSSDLRLGMVVEISGSKDDNGQTGKANTITASSFVRGPVSAIDTGKKQITVLGVTIAVTADTVFEGLTGIDDASFKVGDLVAVHGIADAQGVIEATRIEKKPVVTEARLAGKVMGLNTTAKTFVINNVTVQYASATLENLPNGLANDVMVMVKGSLVGANTINASKVAALAQGPNVKEGQNVQLEGIVSEFTSTTSFKVNTKPVDASKATVKGVVVLGARVHVAGEVKNGVLVATKVDVQTHEFARGLELHGTAGNVNSSSKTFVLRGVAVTWNDQTAFAAPLTAATLANGNKVEVKAAVAGGKIVATSIKLEN